MSEEVCLIKGQEIAAQVRAELKIKVDLLREKGITPTLSVVLVGDRGDSATYVRMKQRAAEQLGMGFKLVRFPVEVSQDELLRSIIELNQDTSVHGIIVQLPIPKHIDEVAIVSAVTLEKDVDGFHANNMGSLALKGREALFEPCTARGVLELIKRSNVTIRGKNAVVVGRSNIVGIPTALLLLHEDATVTICHSQTQDLADKVRQADILVAAIGRPKFIQADWIKPGAVVIDVGTNAVADPTKKSGTTLIGDVDFVTAVERKIPSLITPVPGGVGPMTVAMLLFNTVKSAERSKEYSKREYWEKRFEGEESFEWLQSYDNMKKPLAELLDLCGARENQRVLIAGCGSSSLGERLYQDGWKNITNVDFSRVVINKMRCQHAEKPEMTWEVADCREMTLFLDSSFDVVIDKSTLDAISCAGKESVRLTTNELFRVIKPKGKFLLISYSRFRMEDFMGESNVNRDELRGEDELWKCDRCVKVQSPDHDDNGSVVAPSNVHYFYWISSKKDTERQR